MDRIREGPPGRGEAAAGSGRGCEPGSGALRRSRGHEVCGWGVGGDEGNSTGFGYDDCVGRAGMCTACVVHGVWEADGMVGVMVCRVCWAPAGVNANVNELRLG